jgi:hypothetical protein
MRRAIVLCVLLSACSLRVTPEGGGTPDPGKISSIPTSVSDTCGAKAMQSLIGKPKSQIPTKPAGAAWRVTCTTCPVTMDYSPARLNIFFDEKTGIVKEVKCG